MGKVDDQRQVPFHVLTPPWTARRALDMTACLLPAYKVLPACCLPTKYCLPAACVSLSDCLLPAYKVLPASCLRQSQ